MQPYINSHFRLDTHLLSFPSFPRNLLAVISLFLYYCSTLLHFVSRSIQDRRIDPSVYLGMEIMSNQHSKLDLEETELRLALPGGGVLAATPIANGKRGFEETVDLKLNLSSNDKLMEGNITKDKEATSINIDQLKPPAMSQVVGWPPVRNLRKNILSVEHKSKDTSMEEGGAALVKVSIDGAPYLRKVDLKMYQSYQQLSDALGKMFSSFTTGTCEARGMIDFMSENKLMDLLDSSDYVPTYEDKDGDWMLVGDVPWRMFVESCKRVRIMKGIEAAGLGGILFLEMAGLISQNVKDRNKKAKRKDEDVQLAIDDKEDNAQVQLSDPEVKTKKKRKQHKEEEQQKEMKNLENMLFGSLYSPVEFGKDSEEVGDDTVDGSALFVLDRTGNSSLSTYVEDAELLGIGNNEGESKERKPVWEDEDELKTSVNIAKVNKLRKLRKEESESLISGASYVSRLRAQHVKLNPGTDWALLDSQRKDYSSDEEVSDVENGEVVEPSDKNVESVDDILRGSEDLVVKSGGKLLPGLLEYSRLVDANAEEPSNAPITSVQFHRNSQLLLVGGLDKKLRFFQIDGRRNHKVQSIFLDDCPIRKACFVPDGSQVIISGRRKFFYTLDLVKATVDKIGPLVGREEKSLESFEVSPDSDTIAFVGNEGYVLLVSARTKELIGTLKMNGTVRSMAFTSDGRQLLTSGGDGQIYHWDLRTRACLHKGTDEGCINGTSLCTSPNGDLFAAGSDSGIVNIYNQGEFLGGKRKPIKAIENLTTRVDFMKFSNDAQILAIGSSMKKDSLKLVHIPSYSVFSNWPPPNRSIHYPKCVDFSPHGGFMATGNAAGKVLLYKLHHYHQA